MEALTVFARFTIFGFLPLLDSASPWCQSVLLTSSLPSITQREQQGAPDA